MLKFTKLPINKSDPKIKPKLKILCKLLNTSNSHLTSTVTCRQCSSDRMSPRKYPFRVLFVALARNCVRRKEILDIALAIFVLLEHCFQYVHRFGDDFINYEGFRSTYADMAISNMLTFSIDNEMQVPRASANLFVDVKHSKFSYKPLCFLDPSSTYKNKPLALFTTKKLSQMYHSRSLLPSGSECYSCEAGKLPVTTEAKFQLDDVIEAQQFERETLNDIFEVAREMESIEKKSYGSKILNGFLMATLFYEPSTRTRLSFESAMKRLGGEVLTTENAREFSSAAKGETLEDTIRTVQGYVDIIVLRHFESGASRRAAATASIPIINAGDGPGQHPTQALLDVYTIGRELTRLDGIKLGLVGDLANGRTVRSLAYLIAKYNDIKIYFVSPDVVKMKDDIKDYLTSKGVAWEESTDLLEVASKCDVIYQTRIQRERFGERIDLYEAARGKYIVDQKVLNVMPKHAVVMHPLPRLDEITLDVDADPRAAYFRQAKNGLYIRMALLKLLLLGW